MSMRLVTYPDRAAQAQGLADLVTAEAAAAIAAEGRASIALSGGTTPAAFLDALSVRALPWGQVAVFASDERWVAPDHPRSNSRLLRGHLLKGPAGAARLIDFWTGDATPREGLAGATARLAPHLPPAVLVVGMGGDMHMAGLFPGAPGIGAALSPGAPPLVVMTGPPAPGTSVPEPRISLSLPMLQGARHRHLLIAGEEKRATLERALALPAGTDATTAPIIALLPTLTVHWAP